MRGFTNGCSEAREPSDLRRRSVRSTMEEAFDENGDKERGVSVVRVIRGGEIEEGRGAMELTNLLIEVCG